MEAPKYTKDELSEWMYKNNLENIYNEWVNSNFNKDLKPSIDRLNDYVGYEFGNIRLVTWGENNLKYKEDVKNGINTKQTKAVLQFSKDGTLIKEHYSIRSASRELNIMHGGIMRCCKNKQSIAYGFIWKYRD